MEYIITGVCIIAIVVIGAVVFLKSRTNTTNRLSPSAISTDISSEAPSILQDAASQDLIIQVEMLPPETIGDESGLVVQMEFKDTQI